jgi:hypothetical protein
MRDRALFAIQTLLWIAVLFALAWLLVGRSSPEPLGQIIGYLVTSGVILAARGAPWKRRIVWAASTVVLGLLYGQLAQVPPLDAYLGGINAISPSDPRAPIVGFYALVGLALPVLVLVLFIGRRPSVLWSRDTGD